MNTFLYQSLEQCIYFQNPFLLYWAQNCIYRICGYLLPYYSTYSISHPKSCLPCWSLNLRFLLPVNFPFCDSLLQIFLVEIDAAVVFLSVQNFVIAISTNILSLVVSNLLKWFQKSFDLFDWSNLPQSSTTA